MPYAADSPPFDPYANWLGISRREQPPHHYRLLGLKLFETDRQTIEHAADARMALLKTYQSGQHQALSQRLLNEVAAAKLCLLSSQRKADYDRELQAELSRARAGELSVDELLPPELPLEEPPTGPAFPSRLGSWLRSMAQSMRGIPISPAKWAWNLWVLLVVLLLAAYLALVLVAMGKRNAKPTQVQERPHSVGWVEQTSLGGSSVADLARTTKNY